MFSRVQSQKGAGECSCLLRLLLPRRLCAFHRKTQMDQGESPQENGGHPHSPLLSLQQHEDDEDEDEDDVTF